MQKYYIGSTTDVEKRLKKHLSAHKGFTARAKDWVVLYKEEFSEKTSALLRENQIKMGKVFL